ncbi:MAG: DUF2617 family protein [Magnetococcales bacterium]|nr:DUF2617 family protein [Magnetococcales bacterium]
MTPLVYQDQSADQLRLTLSTGRLDENQFTILTRSRLQAPFVTLNAAIIGSSHFFHFDLGDGQHLYEILACTEGDSPGGKHAFGPFQGDEALVERLFFAKVNYRFHWQKQALPGGWAEMERIESRALANPHGLGLAYTFPPGEASGQTSPKTVVQVSEFSSNRLELETAHLYPNEQQLVITQTILSIG